MYKSRNSKKKQGLARPIRVGDLVKISKDAYLETENSGGRKVYFEPILMVLNIRTRVLTTEWSNYDIDHPPFSTKPWTITEYQVILGNKLYWVGKDYTTREFSLKAA